MRLTYLLSVLFLGSFIVQAQIPPLIPTPRVSTSASDTGLPASGVLVQPEVQNVDTIGTFPDTNIQGKAVQRRVRTQREIQAEGTQVNPNINGGVINPPTAPVIP